MSERLKPVSRNALFGLVGASVAVGGAMLFPPEASEDQLPQAEIVFIGDSNMRISEAAIREKFELHTKVSLDGQDGQRIDQMLDEIEATVSDPADKPDAVVIYLGTNDVMQENPDWAVGFNRMIGSLSTVDCVQLVTVNTRTDARYGKTFGTAEAINQAIEQTAETHPNIHKVDWNIDWRLELQLQEASPNHYYTSNTHPEYGDKFITDGIHHSEEGSQELATRIYTSIKDNC